MKLPLIAFLFENQDMVINVLGFVFLLPFALWLATLLQNTVVYFWETYRLQKKRWLLGYFPSEKWAKTIDSRAEFDAQIPSFW